jgi:hypothetical protein
MKQDAFSNNGSRKIRHMGPTVEGKQMAKKTEKLRPHEIPGITLHYEWF